MRDCTDCGEPATTTAKAYTGPDTYILEPVCADCWIARDNYEPPERDPEAEAGALHRAEQTLRDAGRLR